MGWAQLVNVMSSGLVVLCAVRFMFVYNKAAPWRASGLGRVVMAIAGAVACFGLYTVLITWFPSGIPASVLRVGRTVLQVLTAGLFLQQTRLLQRLQNVDQSEEAL